MGTSKVWCLLKTGVALQSRLSCLESSFPQTFYAMPPPFHISSIPGQRSIVWWTSGPEIQKVCVPIKRFVRPAGSYWKTAAKGCARMVVEPTLLAIKHCCDSSHSARHCFEEFWSNFFQSLAKILFAETMNVGAWAFQTQPATVLLDDSDERRG